MPAGYRSIGGTKHQWDLDVEPETVAAIAISLIHGYSELSLLAAGRRHFELQRRKDGLGITYKLYNIEH